MSSPAPTLKQRFRRDEQGTTLAELMFYIPLSALVMTLALSPLASIWNANEVHTFKASASNHMNIAQGFMSRVPTPDTFRAVINCDDEADKLVAGLTLTPPTPSSCVKVWGSSSYKVFESSLYSSTSDEGVADSEVVPAEIHILIEDKETDGGTRITYDSQSLTMTYESDTNNALTARP